MEKISRESFTCFLIYSIVMILALSGCVPLNQFSVEQIQKQGADSTPLKRFDGLDTELDAASNAGGTLRLLVVQGMGITEPGYSKYLVDRIAKNLDLNFVQSNNVIFPEGRFYSTLSIRDFANRARRLRVYELTWSPLTATIKTNQFALDFASQQVDSRQIANNSLKISLMDESLSDVILYVGKFRPKIQLPITNAIYRIVSDSLPGDPVAILTHSLAGYMVIDTLSGMCDSASSGNIARTYAEHVKQLFMMANQMPILNLSDQTNFDPNCSDFAGKLDRFMEGRAARGGKPLHIQIVAFSDPNDLLSYKLRQCDIQEGEMQPTEEVSGKEGMKLIFPSNVDVDGFNVTYTVNPWSILGIFSWPVSAHDDWWTDSAVPDFLTFGCGITGK